MSVKICQRDYRKYRLVEEKVSKKQIVYMQVTDARLIKRSGEDKQLSSCFIKILF